MTPTEQARRSDALYTDNSGNADRRKLCDMIAHREADIAELQALAHDMLLSLEWTLRGNSIHVKQFLAFKRLARKLGVSE